MRSKIYKSLLVFVVILFVLNAIYAIQWINGRESAIFSSSISTLLLLFETFIYIKCIKYTYMHSKSEAINAIKNPLFAVCIIFNALSIIITMGLISIRVILFGLPSIIKIVLFGVMLSFIYITFWENINGLIDVLHYIGIDIGKYRNGK